MLPKAFRGELVETEAQLAAKEGREFETAEHLLARIRAGRDSSSAKPSAARRAVGKSGRSRSPA